MTGDAVDRYLVALRAHLAAPADRAARVLEEAEQHLRESVAAHHASGLPADESVSVALAQFGDPRRVAASVNRSAWSGRARDAALTASLVAARLGALALVLMGVVGLLARAVAGLTSASSVYGPPAWQHPAISACAHWLAVQPAATTCRSAATLEARDDLTQALVAAGALGVAVGAVALLVRRRVERRVVLPATLTPALAAAGLVVGAVAMSGLAMVDAVVAATWGRGLWWTAAACCAAAAAGCAVRWRRAQPAVRPAATRAPAAG